MSGPGHRIAREISGSRFSRRMVENRDEIRFQWAMDVVRLRNKLYPILEEYETLDHLCTISIYYEFAERRMAYYENEEEYTKIFNDPEIFPFGVSAADHLEKIVQQLEALVFYLKQLP